MSKYGVLTLVLPKEKSQVLAGDLALYIATLDLVYEGALRAVSNARQDVVSADPEAYFKSALEAIHNDSYASAKEALRIRQISYRSPLEIVFYGVHSALIVALVLAGGKFKAFGIAIELNKSLGEALRDLRSAIHLPLSRSAKSSLRGSAAEARVAGRARVTSKKLLSDSSNSFSKEPGSLRGSKSRVSPSPSPRRKAKRNRSE